MASPITATNIAVAKSFSQNNRIFIFENKLKQVQKLYNDDKIVCHKKTPGDITFILKTKPRIASLAKSIAI